MPFIATRKNEIFELIYGREEKKAATPWGFELRTSETQSVMFNHLNQHLSREATFSTFKNLVD